MQVCGSFRIADIDSIPPVSLLASGVWRTFIGAYNRQHSPMREEWIVLADHELRQGTASPYPNRATPAVRIADIR